MSHIYDIYRVVKIARNETRKNDRQYPPADQLNGFASHHPVALMVKKRYIKYRPWLTQTDAAYIIVDAIAKEYLEGTVDIIPSTEVKVDTLCVKPEGRKFLGRTWFIFPTGLWYAWYKEDGKVFISISLSIITLLATVVALLTKVAFFNS